MMYVIDSGGGYTFWQVRAHVDWDGCPEAASGLPSQGPRAHNVHKPGAQFGQ